MQHHLAGQAKLGRVPILDPTLDQHPAPYYVYQHILLSPVICITQVAMWMHAVVISPRTLFTNARAVRGNFKRAACVLFRFARAMAPSLSKHPSNQAPKGFLSDQQMMISCTGTGNCPRTRARICEQICTAKAISPAHLLSCSAPAVV